jgi:hypothetical protein
LASRRVDHGASRSGSAALAWLAALASCGMPNPGALREDRPALQHAGEPTEAWSETRKLEAVIAALRHSGHKVLRAGRAMEASAAAELLERRLRRDPGVASAAAFVTEFAAEMAAAGRPMSVRLRTTGQTVALEVWLARRLDWIERQHGGSGPRRAANAPGGADTADGQDTGDAAGSTVEPALPAAPAPGIAAIERLLTAVEASDATFFEGEDGPNTTRRTGVEFAALLRRKWHWLGTDIGEPAGFLREIAATGFRSGLPYRVRTGDGEVIPFVVWVKAAAAADPASVPPAPPSVPSPLPARSAPPATNRPLAR